MAATYTKVNPVSRGRLTAVWEGRDEKLGRKVAIKELLEPFAGTEAEDAFFERAARFSTVPHPHLLTIHAVDAEDGTRRLITEWADDTLRSALARGPEQPEQVRRLLSQILPALGALHRQGLVHGGIKPSNLFICRGVYKLGDFGFDAAGGTPTADGFTALRYAPPEELRGGARTPTSDLYALGLVAWELLVGADRYESEVGTLLAAGAAETDAASNGPNFWIRFHCSPGELPEPRALVPSIPEDLSRVVARMIRKEPATRYVAADEALGGLLGVDPHSTDASPTPPGGIQIRKKKSHFGLWIGAGVSLFVSLLVLFFWLRTAGSARVQITSEPSGAEILFHDTSLGTTPHKLRVKLGTTLILRKVGYAQGEVALESTDQKTLHVRLAKLAPPPPPKPPPPPPPPPDPLAADLPTPGALAAALLSLRRIGGGLELAFASPMQPARFPVGSPLLFRASAPRNAALATFVLSSDGTLYSLYPSPTRPFLDLTAGQAVEIPRPEDREAGFVLVAGEPLGHDLVFALASAAPLPPPPIGQPAGDWVTVYPFVPGPGNPAQTFARWVSAVLHGAGEAGLASLEMEVAAAEEAP